MTDIQKARIWAEEVGRIEGLRPGPRAAVEVIQSLPDHWIDAEKVREFLTEWRKGLETSGANHSHEILDDLEETLFGPTLPTLADMTPEEREACQWMQAQVFPTSSTLGIITGVDEYAHSAIILFADGMAKNVPWEEITPLPDLPKLEWPGGGVEDAPIVDNEPIMMPRPEDVKPGDCWLVEFDGHEWVGTRDSRVETVCSWALARLDGADFTVSRDGEITLITRLVPEVKP